jgi:hypothetical protein
VFWGTHQQLAVNGCRAPDHCGARMTLMEKPPPEVWVDLLSQETFGDPELDAAHHALGRAGLATSLADLYPFTSMTRLCVSRSNRAGPGPDVAPGSIEWWRDGVYRVMAGDPYGSESQRLVLSTQEPGEAIAALIDAITPTKDADVAARRWAAYPAFWGSRARARWRNVRAAGSIIGWVRRRDSSARTPRSRVRPRPVAVGADGDHPWWTRGSAGSRWCFGHLKGRVRRAPTGPRR